MSGMEMMAYALAAILGLVLCRIFWRPLKSVFVMILSSVLGGAGLYIFNMVFAGLGFSVGINIVTATVCGLFGLPGIVLLVLLKLVFAV